MWLFSLSVFRLFVVKKTLTLKTFPFESVGTIGTRCFIFFAMVRRKNCCNSNPDSAFPKTSIGEKKRRKENTKKKKEALKDAGRVVHQKKMVGFVHYIQRKRRIWQLRGGRSEKRLGLRSYPDMSQAPGTGQCTEKGLVEVCVNGVYRERFCAGRKKGKGCLGRKETFIIEVLVGLAGRSTSIDPFGASP